MQKAWISGIGGYLPLLRLDRKAAARQLAWSGLPMPRKGARAVAGWDEDPLTMAVEASRGLAGADVEALRFASTSAYFTDRSQAGIMLDALALPREVRTLDAANMRRAGTSALLDSLLAGGVRLVAAAEKRRTQAGSAAQLAYGDGAAAVLTGESGAARLIGHAALSHDLVDRYATLDHPTPYAYEERFVRDVSVAELFIPAIRGACEKAGIEAAAIAHAACAEPVSGCWAAVARKLGIGAVNHCQQLSDEAGDLGAAHPLFGLGLAFAAAKAGDVVLLAGFGSGIDAMLFEVVEEVPGAKGLAAMLAEGRALADYTRFLNLSGVIDLDWGMRSEFELKAQATVLERVGREMIGFIGGRDRHGNVQFPKSAIPVNPAADGPEALEDVRLADEEARIVSVTADRLNFNPDPPFDFGLVQFDNGARVLMEMVDRPEAGFAVGDRVRMRLRIKSQNKLLGFRTYFWKAAPLQRPRIGEN
ncbi:OB-fold domain-containing protein [Tsuneonella sp. CC-YZS046]|uniref:OB-fold domain-containing protein n=1 Tax=Tsuneonella sp. CC-YZS046 TaxID=3042152 RepID=UPI002D77E172|nr:OB-fold domain-containing protein [Tsuneonella sp. CC-YZS046]WRO66500.1 OB-fold domain-containing protein [Tsuneonella sp. CC-YZS046]